MADWQPFINWPKIVKKFSVERRAIFLEFKMIGLAFIGIGQLTFVNSCAAWEGGQFSIKGISMGCSQSYLGKVAVKLKTALHAPKDY